MPEHAPEPPASALFDAQRSAEIVAGSFAATPDPRLRRLLTSLVEHLHAFAKDVELTPQEWQRAVEFLTETGQTCTGTRQEFILLSDVLGLSMLVDTLAHDSGEQVTESTVEGPFHVVDSPPRERGDHIDLVGGGEPCLVTGQVVDPEGRPVADAAVDVWQADDEGFYDVQRPGELPEGHLRGLFRTDAEGRFWFRSIVPRHYPIPDDGPVGRLLDATGRHPYRPAHVHFEISAPGMRTLTTHVFVAGTPYLDSDAVFGVKPGLVHEFSTVDDPERAARVGLANPFRHVDFPVTLDRLGPGDQR